jgi:hypothetical protein
MVFYSVEIAPRYILCSVYLLNGVFMNDVVLCGCRLMYFALSTYSMVGL